MEDPATLPLVKQKASTLVRLRPSASEAARATVPAKSTVADGPKSPSNNQVRIEVGKKYFAPYKGHEYPVVVVMPKKRRPKTVKNGDTLDNEKVWSVGSDSSN